MRSEIFRTLRITTDFELIKQRQVLQKVFEELKQPENWIFYRILQGLGSPGTALGENVKETIDLWNLFRDDGRIDVEMDGAKVKRQGFTLHGGSQSTKGKHYVGINKLLKQFDGDIEKVIERIIKPVNGLMGLRELRKQMGMAPQDGSAEAMILASVRSALGEESRGTTAAPTEAAPEREIQQAQIPGTFAFGPKVGEYILALLGDSRYATVDVWESRFARSYFTEGFKRGTGIPRGDILFYRLIKEFGNRIATKLNLSPADAQAVRWFYIKDAIRDAGFMKGSANDTLAEFTDQYLLYAGTVKTRIGSRDPGQSSLLRGSQQSRKRGSGGVISKNCQASQNQPRDLLPADRRTYQSSCRVFG